MSKKRQTPQNRLFEIADSQQGFFTAQQAEEAGFIRTNHAYHVKSGSWIREGRGVYRLARFPTSRDWQRVAYALWSRNRDGEIQGVYSHETALTHYELSDVMPNKLHMTVPPSFRRSTPAPKSLVLRYADLKKSDIREALGFKVTTPLRTIEDIITTMETSLEFVDQAVREGLFRGLVGRSELQKLFDRLEAADGFTDAIRYLQPLLKGRG